MVSTEVRVKSVPVAAGTTQHPIFVFKAYWFSTNELFCKMPPIILHHDLIDAEISVKDGSLSKF